MWGRRAGDGGAENEAQIRPTETHSVPVGASASPNHSDSGGTTERTTQGDEGDVEANSDSCEERSTGLDEEEIEAQIQSTETRPSFVSAGASSNHGDTNGPVNQREQQQQEQQEQQRERRRASLPIPDILAWIMSMKDAKKQMSRYAHKSLHAKLIKKAHRVTTLQDAT